MKKFASITRALIFSTIILVTTIVARGEAGGGTGGRGGPFIAIHTNPLSVFDTDVTGTPVVIGGVGFGSGTKTFRFGGGGGGGFLYNPSDNVTFGMGYGGGIGEYTLTRWLYARLMIGGGGYALAKTVLETESQRILRKLSSGGFVFFYPQLSAEIPVNNIFKLTIQAGYFLPNIGKLQSFTVAANVIFGK
ncbi:MAG: hypothetical protein HYZ71_03600 [Deltaproteobacteria bacterium]|nr:hypothetical protein [Deltaproteobacteria bacterium]